MTRFHKAIAAAALALTVPAAAAAASSTHEVTDYNGIRGLWTSTMVRGEHGERLGNPFERWTLSDSVMTVEDDGAVSMTGTATNNGDAALGLVFDLAMQIDPHSTNAGYCQHDGPRQACDTLHPPVDTSDWTYMDLLSGSLTGTGEMAGIGFDLTDVTGGMHLPQLGVGANAFDRHDLGFSTWLSYALQDGSADHSSRYSFTSSRGNQHLDFNVDVAAVPLPASLPLLAAGFGAVAALRRRRKAS